MISSTIGDQLTERGIKQPLKCIGIRLPPKTVVGFAGVEDLIECASPASRSDVLIAARPDNLNGGGEFSFNGPHILRIGDSVPLKRCRDDQFFQPRQLNTIIAEFYH